jgi:hypothetical protein
MPTQAVTGTVELRHFFITPGVAAAHALSGVAIFAGADSVLKTTPLYLLGLIVQNPINVAIILIVTAVLAVISYMMREPRRSWFMYVVDSPAAVFVVDAFCIGWSSDHGRTLP